MCTNTHMTHTSYIQWVHYISLWCFKIVFVHIKNRLYSITLLKIIYGITIRIVELPILIEYFDFLTAYYQHCTSHRCLPSSYSILAHIPQAGYVPLMAGSVLLTMLKSQLLHCTAVLLIIRWNRSRYPFSCDVRQI